MRFLVLVLGLALVAVATGVWLTVADPSGTPVPHIGIVGSILIALAIAAIRKSEVKGYALAALIAAPLGGLHAFAGRAINVRNMEANLWSHASTMSPPTADAWHFYVYGVSGSVPSLNEKRFRPGLADDLNKAKDAAPIGSATRSELEAVERSMQSGWGSEAEFFYETFTPVRAHFDEALKHYAELRYSEAIASTNPGVLRAYRVEFGDAHRDETTAALRKLYAQALEKYERAIEGKQTDPEAVAGMRALLTNGDVDLAAIPLEFEPVSGIDAGELEDVLRDKLGVEKVLPVGPSFTAERSAARRESLLFSLNQALQPVAGELFSLSKSDAAAPDRFVVTQRVFPSGSIYSSPEQANLPLAKRTVAIGIAMDFECTVVIGGKPSHRFKRTARPAAEITTTELEADPVYNSMASSAYDTFSTLLLRGYGF